MKSIFRLVIGVAIVEVILAFYHAPIAELPLMLAATFIALAFLVLAKVTFAIMADRRHERETYLAMQRSYLNSGSVAYPRATQLPQHDPNFQLMQAGFQMLAQSQQQTNTLLNHLVQGQQGLVRYEPVIDAEWIEEGE